MKHLGLHHYYTRISAVVAWAMGHIPCAQPRQGVRWKLAWWTARSAGLLFACQTAVAAEQLGPLFDRFELTLEAGQRTEALGPFFHTQTTPAESRFAVPPLFSVARQPELDRLEFDFLYPLLTLDQMGTEFRWQLLQLISLAGSDDQEGNSDRRYTLFPIYFQQRSEDPERNYFALFPIYGQLQRRFFRSEVEFVLWPLYVKTTRRASVGDTESDPFLSGTLRFLSARRGDITTYNFPWPILHLRYGEGLRGWQVWPLASHEVKVVTQHTNEWGDLQTVPGYEKRVVLWPLFVNQHRQIGSDNPEHQQFLLPFYNFLRSPQRDSTSYLWPLGLTLTEDRNRQYREVGAPWPFVVFARGEGKTANRVWPLFGTARNQNLENVYYLWPLYRYTAIHAPPLERERQRVLFFLASRVREQNTETGARKGWSAVWPLFMHRREWDGSTRLQVLAVLEPILPTNESIERNYSPLWSVWRSENNALTCDRSHSLLWNLYRSERRAEARKCSLLFGLFQYQSHREGSRLRLFYVPFGRGESRPPENH